MPRNVTGGSISNKRDTKGLWVGYIELDGPAGTRKPRKYVRRKDKEELRNELGRLYSFYKENGYLPDQSMTVAQWVNYWLIEVGPKEKRPKTLAGYSSVLTNWVIPAIGTAPLAKLRPLDVRQMTDRMISAGRSSTYALNAQRVLSVILEDAILDEKISSNPAKMARAPRKDTPALQALTMTEALDLLRFVDGAPLQHLWWLTIMTGARRGEMIGLEVNRVDGVLDLSWQLQRLKLTPNTGVPIVPADFEYRHLVDGLYLTRPKSKASERQIPLVGALRVAVERHLETMTPNPWGLMWVDHNGRPIDPDQHTKNWRKLLKETEIPKNVRLHDLRHSAVDFLYASGIPEDIITRFVGHSKVSMSRHYQSTEMSARMTHAMEMHLEQFNSLIGGRSETPGAIAS